MSAPAKEFEADVLDGLVDAGDNPLLTWCVSQRRRAPEDDKDNIYPTKKRAAAASTRSIAALIARKLASVETGTADDPDLVVA